MSLECFHTICTFEYIHIRHFKEDIASKKEELDGKSWFSLQIDGMGKVSKVILNK